MPSFPKPKFPYSFQVQAEIDKLRIQKSLPDRIIPAKSDDNLLIATWNIANLGAQDRLDEHYKLIAEIISWYDIVAIQEVKDDLGGLRGIQKFLPANYKALFSDVAGNEERMAYLYDGDKVNIKEKIGEIAIPPVQYKHIKIDGFTQAFNGFDRNPYLASFQFGQFDFLLVNVHLYFGDDIEKASIERRCLETFAVARWADLRRNSPNAYTKNIIALGDFNLPKTDPADPIYKALTSKGLVLPEHATKIYSNISNDKEYDQIAFFPGLKSKIADKGVFPFDMVLFSDLYDPKKPKNFREYLRYYISDHRPKWIQVGL